MALANWFLNRPQVRRSAEANQLRRALRFSNLEASFAMIHLALTQGVFLGTYQGVVLTNYIIDLGGSNFLCGLVQALVYLAQAAFFLSPLLVRRLEGRRPVVVIFCLLGRLAWAPLILYLFVPWPPAVKHALLVATLLLSNVCAVIGGNAWLGWMADLVPTGIRGAFYGRRNVLLWIAGLAGIFIAAQALSAGDWLGDRRLGYIFCFALASLAAVFSSWFLTFQYEPPMAAMPAATSQRQMWAALMRNVPFTRFLRFMVTWQFSVGLAEAFFFVHMVRVLKMSPAQMGVQSLLSALAAMASVRAWGRVLDRLGSKSVLITTGLIAALHIWIWFAATPARLWPVWIAAVLAGFAWSGYNLAAFNWPQLMTDAPERQYALGLLNTVSGLTYLAASLLAGAVTTILPQTLFHLGRFEFVHFHLLFALSAIGRLFAIVGLAARVPCGNVRSQTNTFAIFRRSLKMVLAGGRPRREPSMLGSFVGRVWTLAGAKPDSSAGDDDARTTVDEA